MKLIVGGILASLALAGCSSNSGPGAHPQNNPEDRPQVSTKQICDIVSADDVAKAVDTTVTDAKKSERNTCTYTGMAECEKAAASQRELCKVEITYTPGGWLRSGSDPDQAVQGVGEQAVFDQHTGLIVKVGAKDQLRVRVNYLTDYGAVRQKSVDLAKAVVPKL